MLEALEQTTALVMAVSEYKMIIEQDRMSIMLAVGAVELQAQKQ
mgnify:CR=1 FL=1